MAKVKNVEIRVAGELLGKASTGIYERGTPNGFLGLDDIAWAVQLPSQYVGRICTLKGVFDDDDQTRGSVFANDMKLLTVKAFQATFGTGQ